MAPGISAPGEAQTTTQTNDDRPVLYAKVNQDELQAKTSRYLLNFGTKFNKDVICASKGLYVYTASGHKVLDFTSGQMSCLLGHGHPEIVKTITDHAASLDHLFSGMVSPPVISLGERLCNLLPAGLDKAFFLSTGGESNEAAIKMAKVYTGKFEIVGLGASWHGVTAQALGAQYHFGRKGQGPLMPGMLMLPHQTHIDQSSGVRTDLTTGKRRWRMHVLPPGYLHALKRECEKRDMLLIVDEAQTGVGRCGDLMAIDHESVVPDILTLSKTLGNGLPLSAVVTNAEIERVCAQRDYCFYTTHVNDPLPAAVGDKVLEIVVRDGLVAHSRAIGQILHDSLNTLKEKYGCIGDVRGRGLMAGIEIVEDRETKTPALALGKAIGDRAYELGLWANLSSHPSFGGAFRIAPPITITEQELLCGLEILEEAFATTPGTLPVRV
ncbi:Pyridoxal phosphate-dependent transferase major region subdomain 2 [Penicillium brevicompactum]|uniref:Pyridoxal phosphate-dependent transferase major region subdomain 2 n=1 Tax=Penicillium brevicompactum TaxID=5074 RepID=A0A9W9QZZ8_PENBR|nr:Pyridoxal phosphate-dependent transferase major region subdomain 2 [Penicillium brevicompactum]